ncbi:MAG: phosphoenolpyruvate carboxylase, partial [Endomicrobia bacterium]|nr:phosphoenolpyruvate carboxylase [Endomicrobiia bacterium]
TVQSAFKYDNRVEDVIAAIKKIKNFIRGPIKELDKELALKFIEKSKIEYQRIIEKIAALINEIASFIPQRRTRKLHIGLFGYTRKLGKIKLPRAISFCAACYSIGLPPEIIGLSAFNKEELNQLKQLYTNLEFDIACAIKYFNSNCLELFDTEIKEIIIKSLNLINTLDLETSINTEHKEITDRIIKEIKQPITSNITELIIEAAHLRKFLG